MSIFSSVLLPHWLETVGNGREKSLGNDFLVGGRIGGEKLWEKGGKQVRYGLGFLL
jgi:hypothetical protein